MATYLQDGVGAFPQEQGFTPNYNFIMRTLDMRQNQYDQAFAQVKSVYNSVLSADLTRDDNKDRRDEILANAQKALKDLPMVDLSNPKNVTTAKNVFKPFYEDNNILWDMAQTKDGKSQIAKGMALQNSSKEEDRKRYWSVGVQDVYDWFDEFKSASADDALGMRSRRYVGKPQVSEQILKMFNEGKLKRSIDRIDGQVKYTYENGQELQVPLTNLYLSLAENDPEAMEGFSVYGRVQRNRFIKENVANGTYATKELAASAHDKSLLNDYIAVQDKGLKQSTDALSILQSRLKGWEEKLAAGTLTDAEVRKMAQDEIDRDQLKKQIDQYNVSKQNANDKVLRNPTQYLANVYLYKSASDLATALSSVSGSSKIDSNPLYKDFVFPKEFDDYKLQNQIKLEREKSALNMEEEKFKAELKALYGDSDGGDGSSSGGGGGKGTSLKELNVPEVKENIAASGVTNRAGELPNAYQQNIDAKSELIGKLSETKASFIFEALDPNEIVDSKGNVLNQNQMRSLLTNGTLLDQLYGKAVKKLSNYSQSNPSKYQSLSTMQEQVVKLNQAWVAMDRKMNEWTKEIIGNVAATETHPDKVEYETRYQGKSEIPYQVEKRTPGKDEGWIYKHLQLKDGRLAGTDNVNDFLVGVRKDPKFEALVKKKYDENLAFYNGTAGTMLKTALIPGYGVYKGIKDLAGGKPTMEQARTQVSNEFKEKFSEYRDKIVKKWNERGLNVITQYAPIPGGGGTTSRTLTFTGSNKVRGEEADVITADLLAKIPTISGSKDMFVTAGPDKPKTGPGDGDDELKTLVNGVLGREIMNSIKLGKDAELKGYSITSSMVGGSDPNYHAYTITFDADFIAKMKGTDSKPGILGATADKLVNGITIYVNKEKDNTLASTKSSMGEIDILVNTNPQGVLQREVLPGYGLTIQKNPISGGYKIKTNYLAITAQNLDGTPTEREVTVPAGADLSTIYYQTINDLRNMYTMSQTMKDKYLKSQPVQTKPTRATVDQLKSQMLNNRY